MVQARLRKLERQKRLVELKRKETLLKQVVAQADQLEAEAAHADGV